METNVGETTAGTETTVGGTTAEPIPARPVSSRSPRIVSWSVLEQNQRNFLKIKREDGKIEEFPGLGKFIKQCSKAELEELYNAGLREYDEQDMAAEERFVMDKLSILFDSECEVTEDIVLNWRAYSQNEIVMVNFKNKGPEWYFVNKEYQWKQKMVESIISSTGKNKKMNDIEKDFLKRMKDLKMVEEEEEEPEDPFCEVIEWKVIELRSCLYYVLIRRNKVKHMGVYFDDLVKRCSRENLEQMYRYGKQLYGEILELEEIESEIVQKIKKGLIFLYMMFEEDRVADLMPTDCECVGEWRYHRNCQVYVLNVDDNKTSYHLLEKQYNFSANMAQKMLNKTLICRPTDKEAIELVQRIQAVLQQ